MRRRRSRMAGQCGNLWGSKSAKRHAAAQACRQQPRRYQPGQPASANLHAACQQLRHGYPLFGASLRQLLLCDGVMSENFLLCGVSHLLEPTIQTEGSFPVPPKEGICKKSSFALIFRGKALSRAEKVVG